MNDSSLQDSMRNVDAATPITGTPATGTPAAGMPSAGTSSASMPAAGTSAMGISATGMPAATPVAADTPIAGTSAATCAARDFDSLPAQQLDARIRQVWRISALVWIALTFVCCFVPFAIVGAAMPEETWVPIVLTVIAACAAVALVVFLVVLPPIRYARWRFDITPEYLDIARGIIWRKRFIIPFIRVQNTDTRQGPVLRAFGLASVAVSTAAGEHEIPGLNAAQAAELRDRAAEFARLAREDV